MQPPIVIVDEGEGPIVATAIHDGHHLREQCAALTGLDDAARFREEDPFTARIASLVPTRLIATRSRFEVDLNRPREKAVYTCPEDAWGLACWREPPPPELIDGSLAVYDEFYAVLERVLRERERKYGKFVVLDIHSYNHCRDGAGLAAPSEENPEVNLGTESIDRARWGGLVDRFSADLAAAGKLDVRENVKFKGGAMSRWINARFPTTGCSLALEFKKTFMDEWTGVPDDARIAALSRAVAATLPGLAESLKA
ncbi:MAG: N-formylglutamate amidohydrolase [Deltaproteobacteria bacterium]|nr:N-formylglutamate amidohydrolase [Deltaproteobacteria bacterium]